MVTVGIKQRRERERQATQQAILQAALEIASEEGWMADLDAAVDILWATMHGLIALTMAQHIYGGSTRAKELLLQAVNDLLLAWKMHSRP